MAGPAVAGTIPSPKVAKIARNLAVDRIDWPPQICADLISDLNDTSAMVQCYKTPYAGNSRAGSFERNQRRVLWAPHGLIVRFESEFGRAQLEAVPRH